MEFQITIQGNIHNHEQFEDVMTLIRQELAQWNIASEKPLVIKLEKVPSKTDTLGVAVNDHTKVTAIVK